VWIDATDDGAAAGTLIAMATALASTAAQAEVAAKVALLRGYPKALDLVDAAWKTTPDARYGDNVVALILVLGTGQVACSSHLREYLAARGGGGDVWLD
jgi:hypothetical protein